VGVFAEQLRVSRTFSPIHGSIFSYRFYEVLFKWSLFVHLVVTIAILGIACRQNTSQLAFTRSGIQTKTGLKCKGVINMVEHMCP
jgi:hypothetical protein